LGDIRLGTEMQPNGDLARVQHCNLVYARENFMVLISSYLFFHSP
jgi:hypothetical protein